MYWFYNICLTIYWIGMMPMLIYRLIVEDGFYERIKQSIGLMPTPLLQSVAHSNCIWVHAASVGEVVAASPIVREIKERFPEEMVVVSVVTATGREMAKQIIPEADGHIFFPADLPIITERIVDIVAPKVILLVETEIWPNFLRIAKERRVPVMMVNGRISRRSSKRYALIRMFTRKMLDQIQWFCMQAQVDAERIIRMGANSDNIEITGNTKYDQTYAVVDEDETIRLRDEFGLDRGGPIWVAGSTHKGEHEQVLNAFKQVQAVHPGAQLVLAPRKVDTADSVVKYAINLGFVVEQRTKSKAGHLKADVLVLDTIGELGKIYCLADIVFVGGSLVRTGGHNILEPAAHAKPIIVGPHMFNFMGIFELLSSHDAVIVVNDGIELRDVIMKLLATPDRLNEIGQNAGRVVHENQGATVKSVEALIKLVRNNRIQIRGLDDVELE